MSRIDDLSKEFRDASLGDERLNRRLVDLAELVASEPAASFPAMAQSDAQLEATYRFFSNERVSPAEILAPHQRQTARRAMATERVIVAHDTTEFNFGKSERQNLGRVGQGKSHGFYAHVALAIIGDEQREPLGVAAIEVHSRQGGRGRRGHKSLQSADDNEFHRWRRVLDQSEALLGDVAPINVMDREADSYAFLAECVEQERRFVIRMAGDKRPLLEGGTVQQALLSAPVIAAREVPLTQRRLSSMPSYAKHHPPRSARLAQLQISAQQVTLKRPASANQSPFRSLSIGVVHVSEPNPPEGQPAVEWRLWTTEPIETTEDVLAVVDAYRARWRIEEYFKALKTGCAIEKRQLETHDALVRALSIFVPIAWRLLLLRTVAQRRDDTKAESVISPRQVRCLGLALEKLGKKTLPISPTAEDAMLAIARLGGHLKRNGPPGWQILGRGFDKLLSIELGFAVALEESGSREM